jgi:hypothetical protein
VRLLRVVRAQHDVGRWVSRQDQLVASADNAWANRSLGGKEGGQVLRLRDSVTTLAVLDFMATRYTHLTVGRAKA